MLRWAGDSGGRGQSAPSRPSGALPAARAREGGREGIADWRSMVVGGVLEQLDDDDEIHRRALEVISSVHFAGAGFRERVWKGVDAFTLPKVWLSGWKCKGQIGYLEGSREYYVHPPILLYWFLPGGQMSLVETNVPRASNPRPRQTNGAFGCTEEGADYLLFRGGSAGGRRVSASLPSGRSTEGPRHC